jgi:cell wall-associated NlpC family hydrolase
MLKRALPASAFVLLLASCSSMKPLIFNKEASTAANSHDKKQIKFLDISSEANTAETKAAKKEIHSSGMQSVPTDNPAYSNSSVSTDNASSLQFKYAQLMNTDAQQIQNIPLYQTIDDWYGTPYKYGGSSRYGIDCSAFVQAVFLSAFGTTLPRTAREQYNATHHISRTQLQEGDLLFFNTQGGISHVGIYLQNNKFVHASVSGVAISDMFEPYYVRHFVAAGRVDIKSSAFERPKSQLGK